MKDELGIAEIWTGKNQRSSWSQHLDVFFHHFFKVGEVLDEAKRADDIVELRRLKLQEIAVEKLPDFQVVLPQSLDHSGQDEGRGVDAAHLIMKSLSQMNQKIARIAADLKACSARLQEAVEHIL